MHTVNRREFLKLGAAALTGTLLPRTRGAAASRRSGEMPPPAPLGRITTWWRQVIRSEPKLKADWSVSKGRDEVIPLYAAVEGEAPWPTNSLWYRTEGGFIHSGYVHPSHDVQAGVVTALPESGIWTEVCVPIAEARWSPESPHVARKLYYDTIYRVVGVTQDEKGAWWYQIQEGLTWSPGPYVPATSLRYLPPEALAPISHGHPDKWIQISVPDQTLTCFEGETALFSTPAATGLWSTATPRGEFRVLYKRHTRRMIGGEGSDRYDLAGVPFPVYFTWNGVAIHGTYWHNDYGRRHSHGCVNLPSSAAKWVFRWVDPRAPYDVYTQKAEEPEEGTRVVVI